MKSNQPVILKVINLCKSFRYSNTDKIKYALKDVSFNLHKGDIFGILGQNGSGKTILLKILSGILKPTSGSVIIKGKIFSIIDIGTGLHPDLTGNDNINLIAKLNKLNTEETKKLQSLIKHFSELGEYLDEPIKNYSQGMFLRLAFSIYINLKTDILLIDEILSVGDEYFREKCFNKIQELSKNGTTIVVVSHNFEEISRICNKCILLDEGKLIASGTPVNIYDSYTSFIFKRNTAKIENFNESLIDILYFKLDKKYYNGEFYKVKRSEPIDIYISWMPIETLGILYFFIDVYDTSNRLILNISNLKCHKHLTIRSIEKKEVKCTIPSFFLSDGIYTLVLRTGYIFEEKTIFLGTYKEKITFKIIDEDNRLNNSNFIKCEAPIMVTFEWE